METLKLILKERRKNLEILAPPAPLVAAVETKQQSSVEYYDNVMFSHKDFFLQNVNVIESYKSLFIVFWTVFFFLPCML